MLPPTCDRTSQTTENPYRKYLIKISAPTLTYSGKSLGSHLQSGVCSENRLIASELAVDDPVALARDDCRNDRTKVNVVELY